MPTTGVAMTQSAPSDEMENEDMDDKRDLRSTSTAGEVRHQQEPSSRQAKGGTRKLRTKVYNKQLKKLHIELVKLQEWIRHAGLRVVILFEGRDAAGKGGTIKRIAEPLNPRICRIAALGVPTEREKSQWYFQRYASHLPAAGEMVLFDRSWYNRAGVERVMGFCTDEEYQEFRESCPEFERLLLRSGIILIKYWFSISDEEQQRRFRRRIKTPTKRWKLSPMDVESLTRWEDYSRAKDEMFEFSDLEESPWHVVEADDKKRARLNCIGHILSQIPYNAVPKQHIELPERPPEQNGYARPPIANQRFVPDRY
ncbi:MAG: polyphosphate kinase 2 [Planctomycetaceae bacterium]|nr:polyphosphate kinase 2 [Planctomycetaceae bacterium]